MKKTILLLFFLFLLTFTGCQKEEKKEEVKNETQIQEKQEKNNFVSYNGSLKVSGANLLNQYDEIIELKGISSHGLQWYANYINEKNLETLKSFNVNVFRLAMYTEENGYISNKNLKEEVIKYIDMIVKKDMYVIVDWHILSDGNPNIHLNEAIAFFDEISQKYQNSPNIIYEICNEPNGNVTWAKDIKPYAEEVIKTIRKNDKNAIIIVGTSTWSQDVLDPISNKILENNIMYALHFYAGTHTEGLRKRVQEAIDNQLPIFVSEWGTSAADGNGGVYLEEAQKWIDFMKENHLSWCNWSLSDKNESSAFLKPGTKEEFTEEDLSESGKFIKKVLTK